MIPSNGFIIAAPNAENPFFTATGTPKSHHWKEKEFMKTNSILIIVELYKETDRLKYTMEIM